MARRRPALGADAVKRETHAPAAAPDGFATYDELPGPDLDAARWGPARLPLPRTSPSLTSGSDLDDAADPGRPQPLARRAGPARAVAPVPCTRGRRMSRISRFPKGCRSRSARYRPPDDAGHPRSEDRHRTRRRRSHPTGPQREGSDEDLDRRSNAGLMPSHGTRQSVQSTIFQNESLRLILPSVNSNRSHPRTSMDSPVAWVPRIVHSDTPRSPEVQWRSSP